MALGGVVDPIIIVRLSPEIDLDLKLWDGLLIYAN